MTSSQRPRWSSSVGFVLAAAGSAVGLGNIWKFPYISGVNGGGAFVFIYLFCISLVGIPVLLSELYIGKTGQSNTVASYEKVYKKGTFWKLSGVLGLISAFIILSFYSVVGGWILDFEYRSIINEFGGQSDDNIRGILTDLFQSPVRQVVLHFIFALLTVAIVLGGVKKGIERLNKILMPGLVLILIGLLIYSAFLPGFGQAFEFLFKPDFSKITGAGILEAVGHSFFTMSVGVGVMITYGSYLPAKENLPKMGFSLALIDTVLALSAGLVIFSAVFSYGIEPGAGPTLIFQTLPVLFSKMPGGYFVALAFFSLVAFTALTSSISILEVVVAYCVETFALNRKVVTVLVGAAVFLVGILSALSTSVLSGFTVMELTFFDFFDKLTSSLFLPLSGLMTALFVGWVLGPSVVKKITEKTGFDAYEKILLLCLRFVVPVSIGIILVQGLDWIK